MNFCWSVAVEQQRKPVGSPPKQKPKGRSHEEHKQPGLSIHLLAGSGVTQLALKNAAGAHSREEASPEYKGSMLLASVDQTTAKAVVTDERMGPSKLYRAITE